MHKVVFALALMLAAGLRFVTITLAIVILSGWLAARAVGHLWLWAYTRSRHGLG